MGARSLPRLRVLPVVVVGERDGISVRLYGLIRVRVRMEEAEVPEMIAAGASRLGIGAGESGVRCGSGSSGPRRLACRFHADFLFLGSFFSLFSSLARALAVDGGFKAVLGRVTLGEGEDIKDREDEGRDGDVGGET